MMNDEKLQYMKEKSENKKALINAMHEAHSNMKKNGYTNKEYTFICQLLWGGVPVDKDWAIQTKKFEDEAPIILKKYPELNKSFFK